MKMLAALLAGLLLADPAFAQQQTDHPAECRRGGEHTADFEFRLPQVARAIAAKKLDVLIVGAGSSSLPGPNGVKNAYPARLRSALQDKLPGVAVRVLTDVKSRRTAADMVNTLDSALAATKPALVIWQTGTVDAMLGIDPDHFSSALDKGINQAKSAGADVVFVNSQYSPRTESIIALAVYNENIRWVAVQQEIPIFDRFNLMKSWADLGVFDLQAATNKLDIAERVHDCIGRLLADLVVEAAKPNEPPAGAGR
jgi:lysophospholipase L1-like esterase